ncbi:DUF4386 domain-containing protein [uncultured Arcticibacterium sp.]|uniref:DUF4386 domain-containing protein n=1 Tax=uncultured Arcticibacterium sp. TaxID=2173042 RepID=UPI0030FBFE54
MSITQNQTARLAGIVYLCLIITGIFSLMYVPNQLIDWENAAKTVENIKGNLVLFKLSIVSGLLMALFFLTLSLVLYKLFHEVNRSQAAVLVLLVAISVTLSFSYTLHRFEILALLEKPEQISSDILKSQLMSHLTSFNKGVQVNSIFWGLWLFPFGYLVFKSGFLPKFLGVFLMLGCAGYLVEFAGRLFIENYYDTILSDMAGLPSQIGEFGICLWLIIFGARTFSFSKYLKRVS